MKFNRSLPITLHRVCRWLAPVLLLWGAAVAVNGASPPLPPLTSLPGSPRLPGKFVWADLVTDDLAAARNFYGQLFGWKFRDLGGYVIAENEERALCGMFQKPRPANSEAKPRWFCYLSVANVSRAQKVVIKAGGKVLAAPQKMPDRGEQGVFADAEGAIFGVVKSSAGDPEDLLPEPGDWIWIQLFSRDAQKASEFYRTLGGYEVIENNATNRLNDFILANKGFARATVKMIPSEAKKLKPNWLPFVRVNSVSASVAQTKLLGGKVLIEPTPKVFDGKVAVVSDPTGAAIGLLEWSPELLKGTR